MLRKSIYKYIMGIYQNMDNTYLLISQEGSRYTYIQANKYWTRIDNQYHVVLIEQFDTSIF